jgi:hypothetical protein
LEQFAKLQKAPSVKFKDLESVITSRISYNILPLRVQVDYIPLTEAQVLTYVSVQFDNKDLQFQAKEGVQKASVEILGRITTLTRRPIAYFEEPVSLDTPAEYLKQMSGRKSLYAKILPLAPGNYRLNVACKDVVGGNMGTYEAAINVPRLDGDKLSSSSLILADQIEKVPTRSIGMGQFVIGSSKVRPRLGDTFKRDEKMWIYLKLYNFSPDESNRPTGQIQYEIVKNGSNEKVIDYTEELSELPGATSSQVTIEKGLPLNNLAPGTYTLRLKVTDKNKNQVLTPSAQFTVT